MPHEYRIAIVLLLILAFAPQSRVDASCFFPADWMLKGWTAPKQPPCDVKEKEQKGTFKGVANHVNVHQTGILRFPPSETFNELEPDCEPLFHPYGSMFLGHAPLMFAHVSLPAARAAASISRPKSPMKMQSPGSSATLRRTPGTQGSNTLNYPLPAEHTHTPGHLSLEKSPVLGQLGQIAVDFAPVLMILLAVLFASGD